MHNSAAKLLTKEHDTLVLKSLHCLPVCLCIDFEILGLVFSTSWFCTSYFVWHVFSGWTWTTSQILWHGLVVVSKVQDKNFWWGSFSFLGSKPLEHYLRNWGWVLMFSNANFKPAASVWLLIRLLVSIYSF